MAAGNWTINADQALDRWVARSHPTNDQQRVVLQWLLQFVDHGPPDNAVEVPLEEDRYLSSIPEAQVMAEYLAFGYERKAIIREFTPF